MDVNATNHNSSAEVDDGSCEYLDDEPEPVPDNETNSTDPDPIVCSTDLCWDGSSRNSTDCSCPSEVANESDNENNTELEVPIDPGSEVEEDNNSDIEDESSTNQKRRPVLIVALVLVIIVSVTFMFFRRS
ncbi:MAG TPA: hypothetical protein HA345_06880 [Candidatus Thalassarchaeaceae archaeon]|nr:MAG TPA: hypothetical protein D7H94_06865 [Candidatus Poseidoniales archaeon]HIH85119.1 hypothetical protein [Candidatus Thalassarchaeaceae archaeon]